MAVLRYVAGWVLAVISTVVLAVIFQTQNLIARLGDVGAEITLGQRLAMTAKDILHLGSLYGIFIAAALLIAFLAGGGVYRLAKFGRPIVYVVAGAVAMGVMLTLMKQQFFDVQIIGGARDTFGFAAQLVAGAIGGWVFARMTRKTSNPTK
jgi:hypothetical protein